MPVHSKVPIASSTRKANRLTPVQPAMMIDDRVGNRQERGDHDHGPGEPGPPPFDPVDVALPAISAAGQQRDRALSPQLARPPVQRIELHDARNGGEQHYQQRSVPDPRERGGDHDRLRGAVQHLQQDRVGADQLGPERQHQEEVQPAQRDGCPTGDVRRAGPSGPRQPWVIPPAGWRLASLRSTGGRRRGWLAVRFG